MVQKEMVQLDPLNGLYGFLKGLSPSDLKANLPGFLHQFPKKLVTSALGDKVKTSVLVVDPQKDFAKIGGSLFVEGADQDMERALELLCSIVGVVTQLFISGDRHYPGAIFFPERHLLPNGRNPPPFMSVTAEDYLYNRWRSNPKSGNQNEQDNKVIHYCLEAAKKEIPLMLWPHHCMEGSEGKKIVEPIAVFKQIFETYRKVSANVFYKGMDLDTEYYSVFSPVVNTNYDGKPLASTPAVTPQTFASSDIIIVMGEALSHCVGQTLRDLIGANLGKKIYLVRDCTSNVAGFEAQGEKFLELLEVNGGHVVQSTTPFLDWPGVRKIFKERR